jgi:hypothetical protein
MWIHLALDSAGAAASMNEEAAKLAPRRAQAEVE